MVPGLARVGPAAVVALLAWTGFAAAANPGSRPLPTLLGVAGAAVAFVVGGVVGAADRRLVGGGTVLLVAVVLASLAGFGWSPGRSAPVGYGNANAAWFVLLAWAAVLLRTGSTAEERLVRRALMGAATAALVAAAATRSAGAFASLAAGAGVLVVARTAGRQVAALGAATLLVAALAVTGAVAWGAGPDAVDDGSVGARVQLWREAARLVEEHPLTGVGPGRFAAEAGDITDDPALRRAHSAPLQIAAELGILGVGIALALAAWVLTSLAASGSPRASIGLAIVAGVGLHACWDWVLSSPPVLFLTALLAGWAATGRRSGAAPVRPRRS